MHGLNDSHTFIGSRLIPSLMCTITAIIALGGCIKSQVSTETAASVNTQKQADSATHVDNSADTTPNEEETPIFNDDELKALVSVMDQKNAVIELSRLNDIMDKKGEEIRKRAMRYNENYDSCMKSYEDHCCIDPRDVCPLNDDHRLYNYLIEEQLRADWLKSHGQPDIQRTLFRVVKNHDYYYSSLFNKDGGYSRNYDSCRYADCIDRTKRIDMQQLRQLIQSGADLNIPNWDGEPAALILNDSNDAYDLLSNGLIKYDTRDTDGDSLLHRYPLDSNILEILIKSGFNINTQNQNGDTPVSNLLQSSEKYHVKQFEKYIKAGADLKHINKAGNSLLYYYDRYHDEAGLDILKLLIHAGIPVNQKLEKPVLSVCLNGHKLDKACVDLLIKAGSDIHAPDKNGNSFLSYLLIENHRIDSESYDYAVNELKCVYTPIPNLWSLYAKLEERAAEIIRNDPEWGNSGNLDDVYDDKFYIEGAIADIIKQNLFNVNERLPKGNTWLFYVKDSSAIKALIDAGLDVNAKNDYGATAIFYETSNLDALLDAGANVNETGPNGRTPLFSRYEEEQSTGIVFNDYAVEVLLKHGANINAKDSNGNTVLLDALTQKTIYNLSHAVAFLIQNGADVNVRNDSGVTPLMAACDPESSRHADYDDLYSVVQQLIQAGADVKAKDKAGKSVTDYCLQSGDENVVNYFTGLQEK